MRRVCLVCRCVCVCAAAAATGQNRIRTGAGAAWSEGARKALAPPASSGHPPSSLEVSSEISVCAACTQMCVCAACTCVCCERIPRIRPVPTVHAGSRLPCLSRSTSARRRPPAPAAVICWLRPLIAIPPAAGSAGCTRRPSSSPHRAHLCTAGYSPPAQPTTALPTGARPPVRRRRIKTEPPPHFTAHSPFCLRTPCST